jgi:hypothetical protein
MQALLALDMLPIWLPEILRGLLPALVLVVLATEVLAWLVRWRRRSGYGKPFKRDEATAIQAVRGTYALQFPAPPVPAWFTDGERLIRRTGNEAASRQDLYHTAVSRCFIALMLAALLIALSSFIIKDKEFKRFVAAFDLAAVVYALVCVLWARWSVAAWVTARIKTELLRSQLHLNLIFPLAEPSTEAVAMAQEHELAKAAERIGKPRPWWTRRSHVGEPSDQTLRKVLIPTRDLAEELLKRARLAKARPDLGEQEARIYLLERPLAQIGYFSASQHRIHHREEARGHWMLALYLVTILVALAKVAHEFKPQLGPLQPLVDAAAAMNVDTLTAVFIGLLVLSATATSIVVSNNERSLRHTPIARRRRACCAGWMPTPTLSCRATGTPSTGIGPPLPPSHSSG